MYQALKSAARRMVGGDTLPSPEAFGLKAIDAIDAGDVVIVGWPKSGNTWLQNCVAGLLYGLQPEWTPDLVIQTLVPDVHWLPAYRRFQSPMFFKSHSLPRPEYRRVVYLVRDGRDALVSFYHHQTAVTGEAPNWLDLLAQGAGEFGTWPQHIRAWQGNPYGAETMTIRYEDMKEDLPRELTRLCAFAGLAREESMIRAAAENAAFAKMKLQDQRFGQAGAGWPSGVPFVRRGKVGSYQDEMPADTLAVFLEHSHDALLHYGYLPEGPAPTLSPRDAD
jgi:hypothetical protein